MTAILAVVSEKGGVGKTMLVVNLAVAAQHAGRNVAIIDLDPQASASLWTDEREDGPEAVAIPPARLDRLLTTLRENGTDIAIIDTPREANRGAGRAVVVVLGGSVHLQARDVRHRRR